MNKFIQETNEQTILQRCKQVIQSLHQDLQALRVSEQKHMLQIKTLKLMLEKKDQTIKLLKLQKGQQKQYGIQLQQHSTFLQKMIDFNKYLKTTEPALCEQMKECQLSPKNQNINSHQIQDIQGQNQQSIMESKYQYYESKRIKPQSLYYADKNYLISQIQIKQNEINCLKQENKQLVKQKSKLLKYCKTIIKEVSSEYSIDPELISYSKSKRVNHRCSQNMQTSKSPNSKRSIVKNNSRNRTQKTCKNSRSNSKQTKYRGRQTESSPFSLYYAYR